MTMVHDDTIVAPATAPGRAAVGIVRMSGPAAVHIACGVFTPVRSPALDAHRSHSLVHGVIADHGEPLDDALAVRMAAPRSYTGEDMVEFHCHGGPLILRRVVELLVREGARHALPGEFTRRAFINGRIDLTQAEAVADLISAPTDRARRAAVRQLEGALRHALEDVCARITQVLAEIQAGIEFPDDFDDRTLARGWSEQLRTALEHVEALRATADAGRILHDGFRVAITGKPNAGKSSLLNRLAREERALVTDIPGTTRDALEVDINIAGFAVRFIDTAGLRRARGKVEQHGVARAQQVIANSDLVLWLAEVTHKAALAEFDKLSEIAQGVETIWVWSKTDLATAVPDTAREAIAAKFPCVALSAMTGDGIAALEEMIADRLRRRMPVEEDQVLVLRARHQTLLERSGEALQRALDALHDGTSSELVAEDLRDALDAIGEITGSVSSEDLLDRIFADFCIGK